MIKPIQMIKPFQQRLIFLDKMLGSTHVEGRSGIYFNLAVVIFSFIVIVSRRPDAIFDAQFYAEDGVMWYAQAYNIGPIKAVTIPYAGYLHIFPRLVAALSLLLDLLYAPLFLNLAAIATKILPISFFLSARFPFTLRTKLYISLLYLALPGAWEVHANVSNSYLHLALLALMVIAAEPSQKLSWRIFDVGALLISALTGPFCIFLTPIAFYCYFVRRTFQALSNAFVLSLGSIIQGSCIAFNMVRPEQKDVLIPPLDTLFKVLFYQIFGTAIVGLRNVITFKQTASPDLLSQISFTVGILSIAAVLYVLWRGNFYLRLLILYAGMILIAGLWSSISRMAATWEIMMLPGIGGRYYFLPILAFVIVLIQLMGLNKHLISKLGIGFVLGLMIIGISADWVIPKFEQFNYAASVEEFRQLPSGSIYFFHHHPPGWGFTLTKH